jgi:hypothetical protein
MMPGEDREYKGGLSKPTTIFSAGFLDLPMNAAGVRDHGYGMVQQII